MSLTEWYEDWKVRNPDADADAIAAAMFAEWERTSFAADFNEIDDDDQVTVLVPEEKDAVEPGTTVHLIDGDGNLCYGIVRKIEGRVMSVEPDWPSFTPGTPVPFAECPDRDDHRRPEGPNEDMGLCRWCRAHTYEMRPDGETYGDHWPDCSLERRHKGKCVGGGEGHPQAEKIRGYWPGQFGEPTVEEAMRMQEEGRDE